jgi:glycolate oxidase
MMLMLTHDADVRRSYSQDASGLVMVPEAVARPSSGDEVSEMLTRASAERMAVTAAGGQTSTTGASVSDQGALLSMRKLNKVIDVDATTRTTIVGPGVLLVDLDRVLAEHGLQFAPDPTSLADVTVGGAIACNASGPGTLLYGATRAHVRGLTVVLASGEVVEVRRSGLEKNTAGYGFAQDLVDLFVGSEGTLGVIVRAELSLVPRPEQVVGVAVSCPDEASALDLVLRARKLAPRCIEYFDGTAAELAGLKGSRPFVYVEEAREEPSELWLEFGDVTVYEGDAALREARRMRHAVPATMNERGSQARGKGQGGRKVSTDWAVPPAMLAGAIAEARRLANDAGVSQPVIYGHAGNGHPHENFIAADAEELARIEGVVEATLKHVLSIGGTISAEHGIGKIKKRWLPLQLGELQLGVMRAVKRELDPLGLLAPGNIF